MKRSFLFPALILMSALPLTTAYAADSTSFDPTMIKVTAKPISSIPVGTIIAWPVVQNPADWQNPDGSFNWLECNGQNFSQAAYPELFALMGGKLPDLRGLFLRGHGGKSAGLMVKQDDAGRNVAGEFSQNPGAEGLTGAQFGEAIDQFEGAFYPTKMAWRYAIADAPASGGATTALGIVLDASRSWGKNHTTDSVNGEFRPVNQAVRYLVRARP